MESEYELNIEQDDPLYKEAMVLIQLKQQNITNPKKLLKYLKEFMRENVNDDLAFSVADKISRTANCVKFLDLFYTQIHDYLIVVDRFLAAGAHGIISTNNRAHPITLKVVPNWLETPWHPDDELEIKRNAVEQWMNENEMHYFNGKVALFKRHGFSGVADPIIMRTVKNTSHLKRVPGTKNQYFDPKRHKNDLQLQG